MQLLKKLYGHLRLRINEAKSAVDRPWNRKLLGYSFWVAPGKLVKRKVAPKALEAMKERVRDITRRSGGRSMKSVFTELRGYLRGWKEYFRLADTPKVLGELYEWIRHRLRMVQLKQLNRGKTTYREVPLPEAPEASVRRMAAKPQR